MILLETPRLKLCYMGVADAPFMLSLLNTPAYYKYIGDRNVRTIEAAERYILDGTVKAYEKVGYGYYVVKLKEDESPIGICGLVNRESIGEIDIGFAFLPEQEGKGYGHEAASALMLWAREKFAMKRIAGITLENNLPSIRLLEKLGLSFDKKLMMDDEEVLIYALTFTD